MTKTERTIYALVGPTRYNTLPFSLAIDLAMELLFVQNIAMDDIRVTRDIYTPVAKQLGKNTAAVSRQIVRLCNLCWDAMLEAGEVERAARFLGHPHRMSGTVRHGEGIGKKRLFPTANLVPDAHSIVPKRGVYATRAYLPDGTQRVGVTNVGVRPTVSDARRVTVETYLVDYDGDLYGQELRLDFCAYLRPEKKFPSARELHDQIAENIREAASLVSLTERDGKTDK